MPRATYHWNGTGFDSFASCARTAERFWTGEILFGLDRQEHNIWSITIWIVPRGTYLWHVTRDLTNLLITTERLIRFGLDRRRSIQGNDDNEFVLIYGCLKNGTFHVPLARAFNLKNCL